MLRRMSVQITPRGTRGAFFPRLPAPLMQFINDTTFKYFRNRKFQGGHVLSLSTLGAKSGKPRRATVMYFPDGDNAWLIVGSAGGASWHPGWVYNLAKYPDQVWVEIGNRKIKVRPQSLSGEERAAAYRRVVAQAPSFGPYETSTDRELPVIRLTAET
jgi:deazaflavin-dependent oxidoreductase (nitroreductase family)